MLKWTTKGRIEVRRNGELVSRHILDREAWESVSSHAAAHGPGKYVVTYPNVEVDVMPITVISIDTAAPTQPGALQVTAPPSGGLTLTWGPSTDGPPGASGGSGLRGYRVFRANTPAGPFSQIALIEKDSALTYFDPVGAGVARSYYIDAIDNAQNVGSPTATQTQTSLSDTIPNAFSFTDAVNVSLSTPQVSLPVTISGINAPTPISVTGGTYSINNGAFVSAPGTVNNGDQVRAQHTSSSSNGTATNTVVTIGGVSDTFTSTTQAAAGGTLNPAMTVEYVDASGTVQRVAVAANGSTTISGLAPFLVHFDAGDTRGVLSNNNTEAGAWLNLGYRINYGESRGTTWTYPTGFSSSRDEDYGQPIFGHPYESAGTFTTRLKVRDTSGNEVTVPLTVNVTAQPVSRVISLSDGGWGSIVSGGHYQLQRGVDYSSFGRPPTAGKHNIVFSDTGSGANPIISDFCPGWTFFDLTTPGRALTRHIRMVNIDARILTLEMGGFSYCGVINGRVRRIDSSDYNNGYGAGNATQRAQFRYPLGLFLYNTGTLNENGFGQTGGNATMMLAGALHWHAQGVEFRGDSAGASGHILRNFHARSSYRNCVIWTPNGALFHPIKQQALGWSAPWGATTEDLVGTGGSAFSRPCYEIAYNRIQFGTSSSQPAFGSNISPQNDSSAVELHELVTIEDSTAVWASIAFGLGGNNIGVRNVRAGSGTGGYASTFSPLYPGMVPAGKNGPYINETINTRPAPSSF